MKELKVLYKIVEFMTIFIFDNKEKKKKDKFNVDDQKKMQSLNQLFFTSFPKVHKIIMKSVNKRIAYSN